MLFRKRQKTLDYDRERLRPVLRASICTGETAAGFRDKQTGKFTEYALIRTEADLEEFLRTYGLTRDEVPTEY